MQFGYLRDRTIKRMESWHNKFFSEGGREILIKSVIQAIPTYAISCFRIPTTINKEIENICSNFWWGGNAKKGKLHWKKWTDLTTPKNKGGLGVQGLDYL